MTFEDFEFLLKTYAEVEARCNKFNDLFDQAINSPLNNDHSPADGYSMLIFPMDAVSSIIFHFITSMGESEDGAAWFLYDGLDQIKEFGKTEIEVDGKTIELESIKDYYDYLESLKNGK